MFVVIEDPSGSIQIYIERDSLDHTQTSIQEMMRIGDHLGIQGTIGKTQNGQLSVKAKQITPLSKTLRSIPKFG